MRLKSGRESFQMCLCIGNDRVYEVLDDIFAEVSSLFPSEYVHIGGDECPHERWDDCPDCQDLMRKEGLKTSRELQWYFSKRVAGILGKYGKKPIGWDELASSGKSIDNPLTIMFRKGGGRSSIFHA